MSLATKIQQFEQQEAQLEQILEEDRRGGEDDYGGHKEEAVAHQYMTAKFGQQIEDKLGKK